MKATTIIINHVEEFSHRYTNWVAAVLFLLTTLVAARPFLGRLDSIIIGQDNDVFINPWADWWTEKALREAESTLWQTDYLFYPEGADLTYHSFSHLNTAASLLLKSVVGPLVAYNVVILFNYFLAALSMFQLARYLTRSSVAGILAGIVFAFNSHSMYQSSHPVLVSIWCLPWATLFLLRAVRENRVRMAIIAATFVFLAAATSTLLLVLLGIWLLLFGTWQILIRNWSRRSSHILLLFGFLSVVLCLPLLFPLMRAAIQGNASFVMNPTDSISMDLMAPLVPHWIFWYMRGLYFGFVPILFTYAAVRENSEARPWFALLVVAFLFAIGPQPHFSGVELNVTLPWTLLIAPVLRNMYRFNVLLAFALAMLTAFGWVTFHERFRLSAGIRNLLIVSAALILLVDYLAAPIPHTPLNVSPFYSEYLETVPDDVALATVPFGRQEDKRYLYYQTLHGHKITGGVISRAEPKTFSFILKNPILRAGAADLEPAPIPSRPLPYLKDLAEANIGYLVIDKTLIDDVEAWRRAIPTSPAYEDDLVLVYETEP